MTITTFGSCGFTGEEPSIIDQLAAPAEAANLEVEFPRIEDLPRSADPDRP